MKNIESMNMFEYFKKFFKHTTIYAIGNIISRVGAFLLLPLYTRYLSPAEYGTLEIFYVTSAVLQTFLGMMIAHAALRFYFEYDKEEDRKQVISTAFIALFIFSLPLLLLLSKYSQFFSSILFKSTAYSGFFRLVFVIIFLELTKEITLAFLRAKERSLLFISISSFQLLIQVSLNIYMLTHLKNGVYGILLGNLTSIFIAWVILSSITLRYCGINFHFPKLKAMMRYSYPFVLATFGAIVINSADRFFLKAYSTLSVIGLYALGFRFGMVIRTLLIEPFNNSFGPFRFSIMKNNDAKEFYSRTLTYFLFIVMFLSLIISIFSRDILVVMSASSFWDAYKVVPIIILSIILGGIANIFQTGIFLMKRTKYIFYITTVAGILTLILNWLLIPKFNMYGAAMAYFLCSLFACLATYYISQKLYPIRYEFNRIFKILWSALSIYICSLLIVGDNIVLIIFLKFILIMCFPFILKILKFYEKEETDKISGSIEFINLKVQSIFGKEQLYD